MSHICAIKHKDKITQNAILVLLGDGTHGLDKEWLMAKCSGRHSQSESNLAGQEFCAINSQSIMNNRFQKKEMH